MADSGSFSGQTISHFRVLKRLSARGAGEVYIAEDTRLGRAVLLQFLPEEVALEPQALNRFRHETRAAAALNHPNIAAIHDIGTEADRTFLVMEFVDGTTLRELIDERSLSLDQAVDIAIQIADALDAAHSKGLLHRDINPTNIFVTRNGRAKLLDFGLASLTAAPDFPRSYGTEDLLTVSRGMGALSYMSPEQVRGEVLDNRTDLFSFGAVLYEMATGRSAFPGNATAAVFDAILTRPPTPVLETNPAVPYELERIFNKALEKDRRLRYQSAAEIRADLRGLRLDKTSLTKLRHVAERKNALRVAGWLGAVVLLTISSFLSYRFFFVAKPAPPPQVWTKAAGRVPDLILSPEAIHEATTEIAALDPTNLEKLNVIVRSRANIAIYNAVLSPVSPHGANVVIDQQPTQVDFYIGEPSKESAIPSANSPVNKELAAKAGAQHLLVTLSCTFCDEPRIQKRMIDYSPEQSSRSTDALFSVIPKSALAAGGVGNLVFQITGNGVVYDNVVVPIAVETPGSPQMVTLASAAPLTAVGNAAPPPGARTPDLTILAQVAGDRKIEFLFEPSNTDLIAAFGGKGLGPDRLSRPLKTGLSVDDLSDILRDDYLQLAATINQDQALLKALHGDSKSSGLTAATRLTQKQGKLLSQTMYVIGGVLYKKLFVNTAEADLHDLMTILDRFGQKESRPLLIRIETDGVCLPWAILYPPAAKSPVDEARFWGLRYDIVVDPLGRLRPGYYPGPLHYGEGPLVFVKYTAALGADQDVSNRGDQEATYLSQDLGFKGLIKASSSEDLKNKLSDGQHPVQMVVVFTHGRNNISTQPIPGGASVSQIAGGPELLLSTDDAITIRSLEELYLRTDEDIVFSAHPLVILNACETGTSGFFAAGSRNFPTAFLQMGARGVVATEAPVWVLFADDFGRAVAKDLTAKSPVSLSLRKERAQFLKDFNNPLGLLYEYFGGVDSSLVLN